MLYIFSFSFLALQQENVIIFLWYGKQIITLIASYNILLGHLPKSFVLNKGTRRDKPLVLKKREIKLLFKNVFGWMYKKDEKAATVSIVFE